MKLSTCSLVILALIGGSCGRGALEPKLPGGGAGTPVVRLDSSPSLTCSERPAKSRFLVELPVAVDVRALHRSLVESGVGGRARRKLVAAAYAAVARDSQVDILAALEKLRADGQVGAYRSVSIVNSVVVEGTPAACEAMLERPDVRTLIPENEGSPDPQGSVSKGGGDRVSWGVRHLEPEALWDRGIEGAGVIVGIIDSGAAAVHEQLRGRNVGGARGWFDPRDGDSQPFDSFRGHGTGVLSVAVGGNVSGVTLGVAPAAMWTACIGLPEGRYNNIDIRLCADWMLQVAQPDILINAWRLPDPGCDGSLRPVLEAWRAAEILAVFPAGNQGPEPGLNHSPANYSRLEPDGGRALSVGGLNPDDSVYQRSSRGPSACDGGGFPDLSAPARDLVAAFPISSTTYVQANGTSLAAGLAAGAAALLLSAHPEASASQVEAALREGTVDLGPPGPDNQFGRGRLHIPSALRALESLLGRHASSPSTARP